MLTIKPKTRKEIYLAYLSGDMSLELPEPLTRDEVNLYNLCKNKAYGEYTTVKEVLAECQPEMDDEGAFVIESGAPVLTAGETYIVDWNGTEYTCAAQDLSAMQPGLCLLGNGANLGFAGNGEPFAIIGGTNDEGITSLQMMPFDGSTTLTISIRQEVTEVEKISGKYVEGMGWSENFPVVFAEEQSVQFQKGEGLINHTNLFSHGDSVRVVWDGTEYNLTASTLVGMPYVGNASFAGGEDTGEPFTIACFDGQMVAISQNETATVSCDGIKVIYHPIDGNLLPVATESNYGAVMFGQNKGAARYINTHFNSTYEEILEAAEAYRNGAAVWCIAGEPVLSCFNKMTLDVGMTCYLNRGGEDIVRIKGNPTDGITSMEREYRDGLYLKSPSGQVWRITVSDDGTLTSAT